MRSVAVNRLLAAGARVSRLAVHSRASEAAVPLGTFVIDGVEQSALDSLVREVGLEAVGAERAPGMRLAPLRAPRIGIYRGHVSNMPEGWTRWVLDKYGFTHETVDNERIRSGDLDDLDVLIFPDQGADEIVNGHEEGTMPPEYLGGVGAEGMDALRDWVDGGGWVLAMDNAIDFAIEGFDLPVENLVRGLPTDEFFIPGTLLHLDVETADPLAWGMTEDAVAFFVRSQSMGLTREPGTPLPDRMGEPVVYARYGSGDVLASGWVNGADEYVAGRAAAVRMPIGNGQVVLTAFEPHFRGQPHNTFKLLFGVLYGAATEGLF